MARARRQSRSPINIWPGFVDALTQLTMVIVFVLLIFTVGQFYLSGTVREEDAAIRALRNEVNQLNDMLGAERRGNESLKTTVTRLEADAGTATALRDQLTHQLDDAQAQAESLKSAVAERDVSIEALNRDVAALRAQLEQIATALDLATKENAGQKAQIADLGARLNAAMASKLEEMARFRSEFFGRLRQILGDRPDIRVVGDRFVFQSEVLFPQASADLTEEARRQLLSVAATLQDLASRIPPDVSWVLEVDGHTDRRPIATAAFPSNWELSTARAASVVKFLVEQGIPPSHLAAAGFAEWQPIDSGSGDEALARNRRIELKLTQR